MYLVTRPKVQADILINFLADNGIASCHLPIMEVDYNELDLSSMIREINEAGNLLLLSPTTIHYLSNVFNQINSTVKFFTVGEASAKAVLSYCDHMVIYPDNGSGVNALINDGLLSSCEKIVVAGGSEINLQLINYLEDKKICYITFELYKRINIGLLDIELIEKVLSNQVNIGIIITSSHIVKYLIECANKNMIVADSLAKLKLISIHPQISQLLKLNKFNQIIETVSADNNAILTVLRKLKHE